MLKSFFKNKKVQNEKNQKIEYEKNKESANGKSYPNGSYYVGEIKDGKPHGNGKLFQKDAKININKENMLFLTISSHSINENKYTTKDVKVYDGEWKDGKYNGTGTEYYINKIFKNTEKYQGDWKDGTYNGNGILLNDIIVTRRSDHYNYSIMTSEKVIEYSGGWENDKYHGQGEEYLMKYYNDNGYHKVDNNIKYKGQFANGLYNGFGILYHDFGRAKYNHSREYTEFKYKKYMKGSLKMVNIMEMEKSFMKIVLK